MQWRTKKNNKEAVWKRIIIRVSRPKIPLGRVEPPLALVAEIKSPKAPGTAEEVEVAAAAAAAAFFAFLDVVGADDPFVESAPAAMFFWYSSPVGGSNGST